MPKSWSFYKDTIDDWLDDFKLRSGCTKHNVTFLREFKCLESEMSAIMCYLYFLANHINNRYASSMLGSFIRQKKFVKRVKLTLKEKEVTSKYVPGFEREIKQIRRRIERCKILAFDNLRLTPYYPFFEQYGYEEVYELANIYNKDERKAMEEERIANHNKHMAEYHKLERSFNRYYEGNY